MHILNTQSRYFENNLEVIKVITFYKNKTANVWKMGLHIFQTFTEHWT